MDGQRFDNFTRLIGAGLSRRTLLQLAGGIAGGVAAFAGRGSARAACAIDEDCASGICCSGDCREADCCSENANDWHCPEGSSCTNGSCFDDGCSSDNQCPGGICCLGFCRSGVCCDNDGNPNHRCPSGSSCDNGRCVTPTCGDDNDCGNGICCGGACVQGQCCSDSDDRCPSGTSCVDNSCEATYCGTSDNACKDGWICCNQYCQYLECCESAPNADERCGNGYTCAGTTCVRTGCEDDGDCSSGICCGGQCRDSECCILDENPDARCPQGTSCFEGYCESVASGCADDNDCPTGLCCGGQCRDSECCILDDDPDARCPAGTSCFEGVCDPVQSECSRDGDCDDGICCGGQCRDSECCILDEDPDARCPQGTSCFEGVCDAVQAECGNDNDCTNAICCAGQCRQDECCIVNDNPDERCPQGTSCFEGVCDPIQGDGDCCAALRAGQDCQKNECCTLTASPSDYCPSGSSCEPDGSGGQGTCCVFAGHDCLSGTPCCDGLSCKEGVCGGPGAQPKPTTTATHQTGDHQAHDKWGLWTSDVKLGGAAVYLRRLTEDDDPDDWGDGVVGPEYQQADYDRLAKLGANYVEVSHPAPFTETDPYEFEPPVWDHLVQSLQAAEKADLWAVVSFRTGPGRTEDVAAGYPVCQAGGCFSGGPAGGETLPRTSDFWEDEEAQDAWIALWQGTAQSLQDIPHVIGYHILAMPDAPDVQTYRAFLRRVVAAIREVNDETPILIDAPGEGLPNDLDGFDPIAGDDKTLYRVATFAPERYLHQPDDADDPLTYGEAFDEDEDDADGDFDRDWLEDSLEPAKTWAKDNKRRIAIGGYGIPRWQPGLDDYLDDLLDLIDDAEWQASLWFWYPEQGPTRDDAFNLEHGDDPGNHQVRDNPLTAVVEKHWRDIDVRPSNFS